MSRSQLKYWPVLYGLGEQFIAKIKMVLVYGQFAHKALMVLKDDSVYEVGLNVARVSAKNSDVCSLVSASGKSFYTFWNPAKVDELSNKGVKELVWGREYGVAALSDKGQVYYWKQKESKAQCAKEEARPTLLGESFCGKSIVQISCCDSCLFALTKDGGVFRHDGVKTTNMLQCLCPERPWTGPVKYIACSPSHVTIVSTCGQLYVWASDSMVRNNSATHQSCRLAGLLEIVIVKVACGNSHTLALSEDGDVYAWGENSNGQLGIGIRSSSTTPVKVNSPKMGKVADIAAISNDHISAALTCTGQVFVWGICCGLRIFNPALTPFSTLHEMFGTLAQTKVMHSPLFLRHEEKEAEIDVIGSLRQAFDNPSNSDFAIKVEEKPIHVHKSILGIRSVYFQSMFKEQWAENNQSTFEHNDFPYDVYKSFLKYLYTGEIDVQGEKLMEILALANAYCELQLKRRCAQILGKDIKVSNVLRLYDVAVTHESTELEDLCVDFASNHMSAIVQSPQFATLSGERVRAFMIKAAAKGAFH